MKTLIAAICVLSVTSSSAADSLCVATYNLNYANTRGDQVLDAITTADPDVICFQETTLQSEQFLQEQLRPTHPHFYSAGHEGHYFAERFAFASKTKLTGVKFTPPDAGLFGFYVATLEFDGQSIQLVNVHLTPFQFERGGGVTGALAALSNTEEDHSTEIEAIVKSIDTSKPTIVLGDFNSMSAFLAPQRLTMLGMTDAFASLHADAEAHPTWHWPTRPLALALRIDYIFHTSHFSATKSEVLRRDGSDHAMLFAVIDLGKEGAGAPVTPDDDEE